MLEHTQITIAAADQAKANAALLAAGHGPNNFTAGLVPVAGADDAAPTRYWCGIQPKYVAAFTGVLDRVGVAYRATTGDLSQPGWADAARAARGMKPRVVSLTAERTQRIG